MSRENIQKLTFKQKKVFDFIKSNIEKFGCSPTLKEIQEFMCVNTIRGATQFLEALENKALIYRTKEKKRNIKITEDKNAESGLTSIRVVGSAGCDSMNIFADQVYDEFIMIDKEIVNNKEIVAVRAEGNSMVDAGVESNDYVLVEKIDKPCDNEIVLAIVDQMAVIKRLNFSKHAIVLNPEPINELYRPIIIKENNFKICGRVLDIIKNPKNEEIQYISINE